MPPRRKTAKNTEVKQAEIEAESDSRSDKGRKRADLLPLFRLLTKQPPRDHDFRTCPICQRYGITEI